MPRLIVEAVSEIGAAKVGTGGVIEVGVSVSDEAGNPVKGLSAAKFVFGSIVIPGVSGLAVFGVFEILAWAGSPMDGYYQLWVTPIGEGVWNKGGYVCGLVVSRTRTTGGWPPGIALDRGQTVFRIEVTS